jgi:cysteine desulfurase/selenocysteine lyase
MNIHLIPSRSLRGVQDLITNNARKSPSPRFLSSLDSFSPTSTRPATTMTEPSVCSRSQQQEQQITGRGIGKGNESHPDGDDGPVRRVHLNHAGASSPPRAVTDRVAKHLKLEQEIGGYAAQHFVEESGDLRRVYDAVGGLVNASAPQSEIALVEAATVGWTRAFYAFAQKEQFAVERQMLAEKSSNGGRSSDGATTTRVILLSEADYAANVVAACQWARDHNNWMVLSIPSSPSESAQSSGERSNGMVDLDVLDDILAGKYHYQDTSDCGDAPKRNSLDPMTIAIVAITHVPTNSGIINPIEEIGQRIKAFNTRQGESRIKYLVDACQSVGQLDVNVQKIHCHAMVATGRKYLRGPRGTGFLYVSKEVVQTIMPSHVDHCGVPISKVPSSFKPFDGVPLESILEYSPRDGAKRFEFWESNVANRLGFGEAVKVAATNGMQQIESEIRHLSSILRNRLGQIPGVIVHHSATSKCGIVTFQCGTVEAEIVHKALFMQGFELSVVPATSTPMDSAKNNVPNLVRASVTYTNTASEIETFCCAVGSFLATQTTE